MPSIIPSYVYTLFACMIVGTLLILASSLSVIDLKNKADIQRLKGIANSVATKALELVSQVKAYNLTAYTLLNIPIGVGNQRYWIQLDNDSSRSWVDIGFGTQPEPNEQRTYIPSIIQAYGTYVSGAGIPALRCYVSDSATFLEILGGN